MAPLRPGRRCQPNRTTRSSNRYGHSRYWHVATASAALAVPSAARVDWGRQHRVTGPVAAGLDPTDQIVGTGEGSQYGLHHLVGNGLRARRRWARRSRPTVPCAFSPASELAGENVFSAWSADRAGGVRGDRALVYRLGVVLVLIGGRGRHGAIPVALKPVGAGSCALNRAGATGRADEVPALDRAGDGRPER